MNGWQGVRQWICVGLGVLFIGVSFATDPAKSTQIELEPIVDIPTDGFNLAIGDQLPDRIITKFIRPTHNFFAIQLANLPTDRKTTIGLSLNGNDTTGNRADVNKWQGLYPVLTYSDPDTIDAYTTYHKDGQGHWLIDDPLIGGQNVDAGTELTPAQDVIPPHLATQFLSLDGMRWSAWREIETCEVDGGLNIFRITHQYELPTVSIAMRVPYSPTYLQSLLAKLQTAHLPGVFIDIAGMTPDGHPLSVLRLEDPRLPGQADPNRPTIVIYAREHATEPDGSWVIDGILRWLLSDTPDAQTAREQVTWLLIPILDPDDASKSSFTVGNIFRAVDPIRPEALLYANYFIKRLDNHRRLDLIVNLHNLECTEGANIECPHVNAMHRDTVQKFNQMLFSNLRTATFTVGDSKGWAEGSVGTRLSGWCAERFGTLDLVYECNTRSPKHRMTLTETRMLGRLLAQQFSAFIIGPEFISIRKSIDNHLENRSIQREAWWIAKRRSPETANAFDRLSMGY